MANPYVGEIRLFAGNFAPNGWMFCNGQTLSISENEVLFDLIGTTYGGDGVQTFKLPDLQGRIPVEVGSGTVIGETGGTETVTLLANQMPTHTHVPQGSANAATLTSPAGAVWASWADTQYSASAPAVTMAPGAIAMTGGNQPHENRPPYLALSFIISLYGIFPSQN